MSLFRILAALALMLAPAMAFAQATASPYTSATRYDAAGHVTGMIAPDPDGAGPLHFAAVRNTYDAAGRLTRVETGELAAWQADTVAPQSWDGFTISRTLETGYDAMGRKIRDTLHEGNVTGAVRSLTQYGYDSMGHLECTAVRMDETQFGGTLPDACHQAGGTIPDRISRTVYANGLRVQLREGVGTSDEGTEATWDYTPNGLVRTVIDGNGNRAEITYDGLDRQTRWTFPLPSRPTNFNDLTPTDALATAGGVNALDYEEYGYDPNGNRTSLRKRDGASVAYTSGNTLTYTYDALNRMTVKTVPERSDLDPSRTRDVYYSYDLRGLQLSARFDSQTGEGIVNSYDGFGHLASSSTSLGGVTRTLSYAYDANGNRIHLTYPDANSSAGQTFTFKYDGLNRFAGIQQPDTSDVVAQTYGTDGALAVIGHGYTGTGYHYDGVGRLVLYGHNLASQNIIWTFTRNAAGQVESTTRDNDAYAWTRHHVLDFGYATNGLNQYTQITSAGHSPSNLIYDANGNLTSDGSRTFTYDVENRMVAASGGVQLGYDPLGRLAWTTGSPNYTQFLYDGDALVAEYDYSGAVQRRYVHGAGADVPLIWYEGADIGHANLQPLYADAQGSIVAVTDFPGNSLAVNTYDEYGVPGLSNQGRFQYTGQAWLPELGMYYYKARIYSPTLGRFMQTDPIGYADQFNLYDYVGDDPVNGRDPDGQQTVMNAGAYDGLDRATAACGGDAQCGLREWNHVQQGVAINVGITAASELTGVAVIAGLGWGARAFLAWREFVAVERAVSSGRLVLYSGEVPANLARGEVVVNMSRGWTLARNDALIARAIQVGRPIRDSFVNRAGALRAARPGSVLARERSQLSRAGWQFDRGVQEWKPRTVCIGSLVPTRSC